MKALILTTLLMTSCVSIPKYTTRYDCDTAVNQKIAHSTNSCIRDSDKKPGIIEECRSNAMKIYCSRLPYFKRWSFPWGYTVELPCSEAQTASEYHVCQIRK